MYYLIFWILFFFFLKGLTLLLKKKIKSNMLSDKTRKKYYAETGNTLSDIENNKGIYGEYHIFKKLEEEILGYKRILANVYFFCKDGRRSEVDIIMIHETGFYIIESKNYRGYIVGDEKHKKWIHLQYHGKYLKKYYFYNPLLQNKKHVKMLKETLNIMNDSYLNFYVVFNNDCKIGNIKLTSINQLKVVNDEQLIFLIKNKIKNSPHIFTKDQVDLYHYKLSAFSNKDEKIKQKHIENINHKKR